MGLFFFWFRLGSLWFLPNSLRKFQCWVNTNNWLGHHEQWSKPSGYLLYIGDYTTRYMENLTSHFKDPYKPINIHPRKLTCPLKRDFFNRKYIFQPSFFRGSYISFHWFIMENPIKMDDLGGKPTIFGNIHIKTNQYKKMSFWKMPPNGSVGPPGWVLVWRALGNGDFLAALEPATCHASATGGDVKKVDNRKCHQYCWWKKSQTTTQ